MKFRVSHALIGIGVIACLVACCGAVWWVMPTSLPVSGDWTVTQLKLPGFASPDYTPLLVSDGPGRVTYSADGIWTHDVRTGETARRAPAAHNEWYHNHLADGKDNFYAFDHDKPLNHFDANGNSRVIVERMELARCDPCWYDGAALVDDEPKSVTWLHDGRAFSAPPPASYPRPVEAAHGWKDTLTVIGGGKAVRHRMTTEGEAIRFSDEQVLSLRPSAPTAVDAVSGALAELTWKTSDGTLRVYSDPNTTPTDYRLSGLGRGNPGSIVLHFDTLYFSYSSVHFGGLDMRPHVDVYAFRLSDRSLHRLTAFDGFRITLLPSRGENAVFVSQDSRLHYIQAKP